MCEFSGVSHLQLVKLQYVKTPALQKQYVILLNLYRKMLLKLFKIISIIINTQVCNANSFTAYCTLLLI